MKKISAKALGGIVLGVVFIAIGIMVYYQLKQKEDQHNYLVAMATDAKSLVRVSTIEGERTVPVSYRHNGKAAFGIGHYRVRIGFDIEQMPYAISDDTLFLRLPAPQVQILEHEDYGFRVLDVWGEDFITRLMGQGLTVEEENAMKRQAIATLHKELREEGQLERAKQEVTDLLLNMYSVIPGIVIILDEDDPLPNEQARHDNLDSLDSRIAVPIKR